MALAALRWPHRPEADRRLAVLDLHGRGAVGNRFAVFVGHVENGARQPFEVWVNGEQTARAGGARQEPVDGHARAGPRVAALKLESLAKTPGAPFDVAMPPGRRARCRCRAWSRPSPRSCATAAKRSAPSTAGGRDAVLDAMFSRKEPKTGADGTLSWTVDILNPRPGDDFVLIVKECVLPDGAAPAVFGVAVGRLSARAQRAEQAAVARHARDRPGLDRQ